jgi:hypothetical protein
MCGRTDRHRTAFASGPGRAYHDAIGDCGIVSSICTHRSFLNEVFGSDSVAASCCALWSRLALSSFGLPRIT